MKGLNDKKEMRKWVKRDVIIVSSTGDEVVTGKSMIVFNLYLL